MSVTEAALPRVLLVGKPNSGKTLLFNRFTGLNQKVANFPGVTVEVKTGQSAEFEFVDLPGLYSLKAVSPDEAVAVTQIRQAISHGHSSVVVCLLDSTRLERSLVLGLEVRALARTAGVPCLFVLNMWDELKNLGLSIDCEGLAKELQVGVIPISARTRQGLDDLKKAIAGLLSKTLESAEFRDSAEASDYPLEAKRFAKKFAPSSDKLLQRQTRFDRLLLHDLLGLAFFAVVMALVFQASFTWSQPLVDLTESALAVFGEFVGSHMPNPILGDFAKDGLLGGISAVVVFVPQIALLMFLFGILEDSGYLARAAMLCHRPLSLVGLSGKSFVPLLAGHACAIPAIMAARTIESPRARWLTWMAIPLMSCSARLPVYGLLIATVIPPHLYLGGLFGLQGLTRFALYAFGIFSGLIVSAVVNRMIPASRKKATPFVLELTPYRVPNWKPLFLKAMNSSWAFVRRAGGTIFAVSVIVWILGYFPGGAEKLESSYLAQMGRFVAPVFTPLGLDWKVTVAVLTSFLAREVFVGTLGVLWGIADATDRASEVGPLLGGSGLNLANGLALMVFFAVSLQCASTLAVLKKESGSKTFPAVMFVCYTVLAYLLAVVTYYLARPMTS